MFSKDLIDRLKLAQDLTAVIDQLSEPVARELGERLAPYLQEDETLPDLQLMQRLMGRLVMSELRELLPEGEVEGLALIDPTDGDA